MINNIPVYFKKLYPDSIIPTWGHSDTTNMAIDFYAHLEKEEITVFPKSSVVVSTGVSWYIDIDNISPFEKTSPISSTYTRHLIKIGMLLQSRSGLAFKYDIESSNAGVIDESYTGEIKVKLYNLSNIDYVIKQGDRITQGIIMLLPFVTINEWHENKDIPETSRGTKGFGSSGK